MLRRTLTSIARITVLSGLFCMPMYAHAQTTVRDFITWTEDRQGSFFRSTIFTSAVIASQISPELVNCIDGWYASAEVSTAERNQEILDVMERFPDSHPTTILVAIIQRECGNFGDAL